MGCHPCHPPPWHGLGLWLEGDQRIKSWHSLKECHRLLGSSHLSLSSIPSTMVRQIIITGGDILRLAPSEVGFMVGDGSPEAFKILPPQVDLLLNLPSRGLVRLLSAASWSWLWSLLVSEDELTGNHTLSLPPLYL